MKNLPIRVKSGTADASEEHVVQQKLRIFAVEHTIREYSVYLSGPIEEPPHYEELCHLLRTAQEHDKIYIHINTAGGSVSSGLAIIEAIRDSNAEVITILDPEGYSMGALIFLAGHKMALTRHSRMMIHNYSSGMVGKGNEQVAEIQSSFNWFEGILTDLCYPFLSKAEIKAVMDGRDIWLSAPEILARLQNAAQKNGSRTKSRNRALKKAADEGLTE